MAPRELMPNDRIIFGTGTVMLYRCQNRDSEVQLRDTPENPITYEYAIAEKGRIEHAAEERAQEEARQKAEQESAAKMEALRQQMEAEKAA